MEPLESSFEIVLCLALFSNRIDPDIFSVDVNLILFVLPRSKPKYLQKNQTTSSKQSAEINLVPIAVSMFNSRCCLDRIIQDRALPCRVDINRLMDKRSIFTLLEMFNFLLSDNFPNKRFQERSFIITNIFPSESSKRSAVIKPLLSENADFDATDDPMTIKTSRANRLSLGNCPFYWLHQEIGHLMVKSASTSSLEISLD